MRVIDRIGVHATAGSRRAVSDIDLIMVHRVGKNGGTWEVGRANAKGLSNFRPLMQATGGKFPYHFVIDPTGVIEQTQPITTVAPHAMSQSHRSVAVACFGDFRSHAPSRMQCYALAHLISNLIEILPDVRVVGHTDVPGATADESKRCPGDKMDLEEITHQAEAIRMARAARSLVELGVTLEGA